MLSGRSHHCHDVHDEHSSERGFTLIELMTVIAVLAVLAVVAAPSFSRMVAQQRLRDATSALTESLWLARSEAITRNASTQFTFTSIGNGWQVVVTATNTAIQAQDPIPTIASGTATYTFNAYGRLTGAGDLEITHSGTDLKRCLTVTTAGKVNTKEGAC